MNRDEAVNWCKLTVKLGLNWPKTTRYPSPDGWSWLVRSLPYQNSEIYLGSNDGNYRIFKGEIIK